MKQPYTITPEIRKQLMELAAGLKGDLSYFELGRLLGTDGTAISRTVGYGQPPSASWLLWWRLHSPHHAIREWAQATLEVLGVLDEKDRRD